MQKVEEKLTYEKAYSELERIMQDLQEDKISVDELTGKVKRAVVLITFCNEMLRSTEAEVGALVKKLGL
ncbi:MAG: exodeoxyribonuclease VII small subunit [Flavobacteriales bacterium]|jgi:exodeoxyribonuclease VII small subunit|nr:exodeoxyribonuclease VII small subunit [Flavobacteriales bacterium]MBK6891666.1 exodeoxyribonuclease VII small subunit [Flavobacteriales bacterium]MBK7247592.1 exodeoxyribonuclease VII small subunit [Flavobacteriales bacterium]MBK9061158.1 exodeoxyribonuclease VII small subunit [Flavobacteriales bacterium]MBK9596956.1 exodeoxyribonuclease VII small subunit [Flavobacteriales bacterium]